MSKAQVVLLYHYFHPDDVISARLFSQLATNLSEQGFDVTAMPANRSCHDQQLALPSRETFGAVNIQRVWRPAWKQSSNKGRMGNAVFMLLGWTMRALFTPRSKHETVIVGTDPILGLLAAIPWRLFRPRAKIVHWCHDLYPHAAVADGVVSNSSWLVRMLNMLMRLAYRRCDVIADLGPCMRHHLIQAFGRSNECQGDDQLQTIGSTQFVTITPWALVEPSSVSVSDPTVRQSLFGDASLGLLYSGNLGRAHEFEGYLTLSRLLRHASVAFCFSGRGPRMQELKEQLTADDGNISFAGFADESELERRLAAADVHLVSLQSQWTGCVVPSKFFGALAIGRPILFLGDSDAAIAQWIRRYAVGWVLNDQNIEQVAQELQAYQASSTERDRMNQHCQTVYKTEFARAQQLNRFTALCAQ